MRVYEHSSCVPLLIYFLERTAVSVEQKNIIYNSSEYSTFRLSEMILILILGAAVAAAAAAVVHLLLT